MNKDFEKKIVYEVVEAMRHRFKGQTSKFYIARKYKADWQSAEGIAKKCREVYESGINVPPRELE